ncbi:hypothetical protein AM228_09505 [Planktothricoides sp. SR001]|uniref:hypothetical protein n=1 Tax=Planktothricoides sp. SR001 TaxID=1705388 RepID=UPI0006C6C053|nr:hypothetical protein [Planktothricoides sp. SR001]KOR37018.1 hypothetical protein AM228_09505 [Planktothricoides sp. SR001]
MWNWLEKLWQSAKNLVAAIFQAFMDWILFLIEVTYIAFITSVILTYFAYAYLLYFMFYVVDGQAVVEIWNPREAQGRSKISKLERAPSGVTKPSRQQADVLQASVR